jgi:hypothetical protein
MCHKSSWAWVWVQSGEQILAVHAGTPGCSPLFWLKLNILAMTLKKKPNKITALLGFDFF